MYVQCERCKTDYEFDDALVSERGTTVKCTSCGHQFKVYRPGAPGETGEDRWVVTLRDGKQLLFTSMKELQRAILAHRVGRNDTLARGGAPPRRLGSIAELEPFLDHRIAPPSAAAQHTRTTRPPPPEITEPMLAPPRRSGRNDPSSSRVATLRPSSANGAIPPPREPAARPLPPPPDTLPALASDDVPQDSVRTQVGVGPAPPTFERETEVPGAARDLVSAVQRHQQQEAHSPQARPDPRPAPAPEPRAFGGSAPPPAEPSPPPPFTVAPWPPPRGPHAREPMPSYDEHEPRGRLQSMIDEAPAGGRPSRLGGWVLGFVLLAGTSAVALYVVRPDFSKLSRSHEAAAPLDPRAQQYLAAGETALGHGDLEAAKESFDKASALAEHDPKVLVDVARLAAIRADVPWLKQRLLAPDSDEIQTNKSVLDDLSAKAKRASDDAVHAAPDDPAAERVRVDALRIAGDRDAARALVRKVTASPSQPDAAYVLAALDLAEIDPPWPVVIERLRTASTDENGAGRGRAALVYALAKSGDAAAARQELDRMRGAVRAHPLLPLLAAFVDRAAPAKDGGAPLADPRAAASASSAGASSATAPDPRSPGALSDPRQMVQLAEAAKGRRDFARARTLYNAALARNGADSEALAGLGDVAHAQHDLQGSLVYYKRAIAANPTYLPALTGKADVEWEMGDRGPAAKDYKEITDRFPEGSYAARVKERAGEAAPPPPPAPLSASPPSTAPAPTAAPSASPSAAPAGDTPSTGGPL